MIYEQHVKPEEMSAVVGIAHPKTIQKTKKKKNPLIKVDKAKMWDTFDMEKTAMGTDIECIYQQQPDNDLCSVCGTTLILMEDGFPT